MDDPSQTEPATDFRTIFVAGATGATGRLLVRDLLARGHAVRVIVRAADRLPKDVREHVNLTVWEAGLFDIAPAALAERVAGCDGLASCLGHTVSLKGVFGPPRRLVTDAVRRLCAAAIANEPAKPVRFVLMNSAGCRNRDLDEPTPFAHRLVIALLRHLVPPHADNEQAAECLRTTIGQDHPAIAWAAVRPDSLVDADAVSDVAVHASPTRSAILNPGQTSRINVARFMADLLTQDAPWTTWQGRMPVLYNAQLQESA